MGCMCAVHEIYRNMAIYTICIRHYQLHADYIGMVVHCVHLFLTHVCLMQGIWGNWTI